MSVFDPRRMRWRTGRKVGRTIYAQFGNEPADHDILIGVMDWRDMAEDVVREHNRTIGILTVDLQSMPRNERTEHGNKHTEACRSTECPCYRSTDPRTGALVDAVLAWREGLTTDDGTYLAGCMSLEDAVRAYRDSAP